MPPMTPMRLRRRREYALAARAIQLSLAMAAGWSGGAYSSSAGTPASRSAPRARALLGSANLPWTGHSKQGAWLARPAASSACALSPRRGTISRRSGFCSINPWAERCASVSSTAGSAMIRSAPRRSKAARMASYSVLTGGESNSPMGNTATESMSLIITAYRGEKGVHADGHTRGLPRIVQVLGDEFVGLQRNLLIKIAQTSNLYPLPGVFVPRKKRRGTNRGILGFEFVI